MTRTLQQWSLVSLSVLVTLFSTVQANCTNYTAKPNQVNSDGGAYTSIAQTHRVSEIVNCTGSALGSQPPQGEKVSGPITCPNNTCWIATPPYFFVETGSSLNVSHTDDTFNSIMELLKTSIQYKQEVDWNGTVAYAINTYPQGDCGYGGQASYMGFTPYTLCTEGILSGCSGDGPADNTAIRACGTLLLNNDMLDGEFHLVTTGADFNASTAAAPPNATIPDNSGNVPGNSATDLSPFGSGKSIAAWIVASISLMWLL